MEAVTKPKAWKNWLSRTFRSPRYLLAQVNNPVPGYLHRLGVSFNHPFLGSHCRGPILDA
jgi:hypothetical protein